MNRYRNTIVTVSLLVVAGLAAIWFSKPVNGPSKTGSVEIDETVTLPPPPEPPPPANQPARIREVYEAGKTYRRSVNYQIHAVGQSQRFGLGKDYAAVYGGWLVVDSTIESNDGSRLVTRVKVSTAKTVEARQAFTGAKIDLGRRAHNILELVGVGIGLFTGTPVPIGSSRIIEGTLNKFLDDELARELIQLIPLKAIEIEDIEGFTFRVEYVDGRGVTRVTMLEGPGHRDFGGKIPFLPKTTIEEFFSQYNPVVDLALFPDEDIAVGESWQVNGKEFPAIFPPQLRVTVDGALTVRRLADANGTANLMMPGADRLRYTARPKGRQLQGQFSLKGDMQYDLHKRLVSQAEFAGHMPVEQKSTDHWIFEMKHSTTPEFTATFTTQVLDH